MAVVRFAVMIEGQEDVTWEDWVALAQACERLGFEALFRSDHYGSVDGVGGRGSLDAWATLSALAAITSRLRLGTLVSPAHVPPSLGARPQRGDGGPHLRRAGRARDRHRLERGRAPRARVPLPAAAHAHGHARRAARDHPRVLGRGAVRLRRRALDRGGARRATQARAGPAAGADGRGGEPGGAGLAARWAAEYNVVSASPAEAAAAGARLDAACEQAGRDPGR